MKTVQTFLLSILASLFFCKICPMFNRIFADFSRFPRSSFPCVFGNSKENYQKKQGLFVLNEPQKSLGKKGKPLKKQGIPWKGGKNKEFQKSKERKIRALDLGLRSRRPATGVSRALRARSVPESVPENGGCPRECPTGCPKSVPRVSPECPGHLFDTPGTLSGHFLDTPEPGARRALWTLRRTLPRTAPVFGDTLGDTPGTLRARRARETPVAGQRDHKFRPILAKDPPEFSQMKVDFRPHLASEKGT